MLDSDVWATKKQASVNAALLGCERNNIQPDTFECVKRICNVIHYKNALKAKMLNFAQVQTPAKMMEHLVLL